MVEREQKPCDSGYVEISGCPEQGIKHPGDIK